MIGKKFTRLTVKRKIRNTDPVQFHCECECGGSIRAFASSLRKRENTACRDCVLDYGYKDLSHYERTYRRETLNNRSLRMPIAFVQNPAANIFRVGI